MLSQGILPDIIEVVGNRTHAVHRVLKSIPESEHMTLQECGKGCFYQLPYKGMLLVPAQKFRIAGEVAIGIRLTVNLINDGGLIRPYFRLKSLVQIIRQLAIEKVL